LKKLPAEWSAENAGWLTLQLKNEDVLSAVEKELALFMGAQKQQTARITRQARTLKTLATLAAIILATIVFGLAIFLLLKHPDFLHR
jgi:hypothetical protein